MLLTFLLLAAPCPQDLGEIARVLRAADDKAAYEKGAYEAARTLAGMAGTGAMRLRLELFDGKLETWRGVYLRDWFYTGMRKAEALEEAALLVQAARDRRRSELLRLLCLRALAACPAPIPAGELLDRRFLKAAPALRREWSRTVGLAFAAGRLQADRRLAPRLEQRVRELLGKAGPPYAGLAALPERDPETVELLATAATGARDPGDRAEALRLLGPGPAFLEALPRALADEAWGPKAAALETVLAGKAFRAVPLLVSALPRAEKEGGRLPGDLARTLMRLTGQQFGSRAELWQRWWQDQGEAWLARAEAAGVLPAPAAAAAPDTTRAVIFGLPVRSERVAVVVDGSGSMRMGRIGDRSSAEAAADELERFLSGLPEGARFNLWVAGRKPVALFPGLAPAKRRNREQAVLWLRDYDFGGPSALVEALQAAQADPAVDTLVLISDGGSSAGMHQYAGHMLEALAREHRRSGVRIHCVCVGTEKTKQRFLEQLAAATGGRMVRAVE